MSFSKYDILETGSACYLVKGWKVLTQLDHSNRVGLDARDVRCRIIMTLNGYTNEVIASSIVWRQN
jgi:hypothetical protein